jgi:acetyl-CoA C-acetyltransferase
MAITVENVVKHWGISRKDQDAPAVESPHRAVDAIRHCVFKTTGSILTVKALYEFHRMGGHYALVTMCIGSGRGIAATFENVAD